MRFESLANRLDDSARYMLHLEASGNRGTEEQRKERSESNLVSTAHRRLGGAQMRQNFSGVTQLMPRHQ